MPQIYRYLGIIISFYSKEHLPIHVHGRFGEYESKAEIIMKEGVIVEIRIANIKGKRPLPKTQMKNFIIFVEQYSDQIVEKWTDYFIRNKEIHIEKINKKV